jgi:hypothetical protein
MRDYSGSCPRFGDPYGNRIIVNPIKIDMQAGVGQSVVDGTGTYYPTTHQFVYFAVWAYSYKFGRWYHSPSKRVLDGFPGVTPVEAYDPVHGFWSSSAGGIDNPDLSVGPNAVSLSPSTGSGTWYIEVQTYWAPPFVNETLNDVTNPNAAPGGSSTFDGGKTCTF